jgi:uncharacterized iron-regulated protein
VWLLATLTAGCAGHAPVASSASTQSSPSPSPSLPWALPWASRLDIDNPLVGRVFDTASGQFISVDALTARVAESTDVFLGEQHDNPDHHRLQAALLDAMVHSGKRPSLVVEMLDRTDQAAIDAARAASPDDPDAIARASRWDHSGWPPWALYRPVFAAAGAAHLPVVAAGLDRPAAHALVKDGMDSLDGSLVERFHLTEPLASSVGSRIRDEMRDAHCGLLPETMLDGMVAIQRARDAFLAAGVADATAGAVVIAGNGHARTDSGAPAAFTRATGKRALSVAFVEVLPGKTRPGDYASSFGTTTPPFDVLWFTPRTSDTDHCDELRKAHPAVTPVPATDSPRRR